MCNKPGCSLPSNSTTNTTTTPSHYLSASHHLYLGSYSPKTYFSELYVENKKGEWTIFKLSDLEGAIVVNGPNRAVAAEAAWRGLIFGNNFPVVSHFQVGNVCSSASTWCGRREEDTRGGEGR